MFPGQTADDTLKKQSRASRGLEQNWMGLDLGLLYFSPKLPIRRLVEKPLTYILQPLTLHIYSVISTISLSQGSQGTYVR